MTEAYFVGDAAGRPGDHSGTDRKWAVNAGVKFYTPEVRLSGDCRSKTMNLDQFRNSSLGSQHQSTTSSDMIPHH